MIFKNRISKLTKFEANLSFYTANFAILTLSFRKVYTLLIRAYYLIMPDITYHGIILVSHILIDI